MFCNRCGNRINNDIPICPHCGNECDKDIPFGGFWGVSDGQKVNNSSSRNITNNISNQNMNYAPMQNMNSSMNEEETAASSKGNNVMKNILLTFSVSVCFISLAGNCLLAYKLRNANEKKDEIEIITEDRTENGDIEEEYVVTSDTEEITETTTEISKKKSPDFTENTEEEKKEDLGTDEADEPSDDQDNEEEEESTESDNYIKKISENGFTYRFPEEFEDITKYETFCYYDGDLDMTITVNETSDMNRLENIDEEYSSECDKEDREITYKDYSSGKWYAISGITRDLEVFYKKVVIYENGIAVDVSIEYPVSENKDICDEITEIFLDNIKNPN